MVTLANKAKNKLISLLRNRVSDPNSASRVGSQWIYPDKPRVDLTKNSYPRIAVIDENEEREVMDVAGNTAKISRISIMLYIWGNKDDPMILTISSVAYEGQYLLDYMIELIKEEIESHISDLRQATPYLHDYRIVREREIPDDEGIGRIIKEIVVEFSWE